MTESDQILRALDEASPLTSTEILERIDYQRSSRTLNRLLEKLVSKNLVERTGANRGTKYKLSRSYGILHSIDVEEYFTQDIDDRDIEDSFNHDLLRKELHEVDLFTAADLERLNTLQGIYQKNVSELTGEEYLKEIERLAIDLSWKSSQIEGNTYSLLETERLLKEKLTASGKDKDEAVMLLNHKDAIDFIVEHPEYLKELSIGRIEDIHSLLTKELGINRNLRSRRVGITGTNYRPLDNEFQIKEAFRDMCSLINAKKNVFEKSLIALVLISYIQGFMDGNKRTARITSNAILIANGYCPISFRTVDSIDYKKAMLVFYEKNNITAFKRIFIDQFEFAVKTYF
ncbi:Fic family protein [Neolewinella antarctica]|uniref:Transcriptional regulator n=1 Tax=Neolewinella antarctica TaxID=442734 RepID=A0ABX0XI44_9BACT|nr:Fic family protein [Neolewinella antarctica]NJC28498.1 putative transcriptional regulator [Neolewinella antarctica]